MAEDYYQTLQVSRSASNEEIQKAYRKLARKHHPDLHADKSDREKEKAKQQFQQIQHAYDVLNDPEKREMYDRFGPGFESAGGGGGGHPFQGGNPFEGMDIDFSQIFGGPGGPGANQAGNQSAGFENLFRHFGGMGGGNGPGPQAAPNKGNDVEQEITVPFNTAVIGGEHQVSLQRRDGKVDRITVKIPAGIEDGKKIRLRGQGEMGGPRGKRGDLLIKVKVAGHPVYSRSGLNLKVTIPITLLEAVSGAKIDVPTPHGTLSVTVPERTQNGKTLRLKGMGIHAKSAKGDLLVELQFHIPSKISDSDMKLLSQLSEDWSHSDLRNDIKW
ncbi:MAG: DnaJ C-terminal domain-containing protein [Planctomycetota bacterium]